MPIVGEILEVVGGIGSLVCLILVIIQMFKRGKTGLGIACIVLAPCCLIGFLIAFIYGWIKNREWGLNRVMITWTVCFILWVIGGILNPVDYSQLQQQIQQQQQQQGH